MLQSYFTLLNLEPRFGLAPAQLEGAYRAVASQVHPDRYTTAPPSEQRQALTLAADANEAYRTLKKPGPRARYLLSLRGIDVSENGASVAPEFLMEQMELREALSDAQAARNTNSLLNLHASARKRAALLHSRLESLLDVEMDNVSAARSVLELMFIEKLVADIDEARALLEE
jgi:molecular chaperone HscB